MSVKSLQVIWLYGMPRSGTNWVSQIFASCPEVRLKLCPLFSYEFKNACDESSSSADWMELFHAVYNTKSEFLDQDHLRKKDLIPHFKTNSEPEYLVIKSNRYHHLIPSILDKVRDLQLIYIVRNPCATLYSWIRDPKEFPASADPNNEWRKGLCRKNQTGEFWGFEDWKVVSQQALEMTSKFADRHTILRYEDLIQNPSLVTQNLFKRCSLPFTEQTRGFIDESCSVHNDDPHSVYKGNLNKELWREGLPQHIIDSCYEEVINSELEIFL